MKHAPFIACLALAAIAFLPKPSRPNKAEGPVADFMTKVERADRAEIRRFYSSLADVTKRDAGRKLLNTTQWRAMYQNSLILAFDGTGLVRKYKDLDKTIDPLILKGVGLVPVPMTQSIDGKQAYEIITENCQNVADQCE